MVTNWHPYGCARPLAHARVEFVTLIFLRIELGAIGVVSAEREGLTRETKASYDDACI